MNVGGRMILLITLFKAMTTLCGTNIVMDLNNVMLIQHETHLSTCEYFGGNNQ